MTRWALIGGQNEVSNPINELCDALDALFQSDPLGAAVPELLDAYTRDHSDWELCRHLIEDRYTRNLVRRTEDYEMLVLCWAPDQESPVHSHMGQRCWMSVLEGTVEEVHFRRQEGGGGPLIEGLTRSFRRGQSAFINDDIALHLVRGAGGEAAASLHVYSKPFDVCLIYDRETGVEAAKALTYHSVEGIVSSA